MFNAVTIIILLLGCLAIIPLCVFIFARGVKQIVSKNNDKPHNAKIVFYRKENPNGLPIIAYKRVKPVKH